MPDEKLLTTGDVAEWLGYSPKTLGQWRHNRIGPAYVRVLGKMIRYRQSDVEAWIEGQVEQTAPKRVEAPRKRLHRARLRLKW